MAPDPMPRPRSKRTTLEEMSAAAIALRPKLLLRARELCGRRDVDAEDLVSVSYLAMVEKRPDPRTETELLRWLRTVMRNLAARAYRDLRGATFVSYEALEETRARGRR
jgi:DNA-directed RNA polymerase specialized sigma24 family protein